MKRLLTYVATSWVLGLGAMPAQAHSPLDNTVPGQGAVVTEVPTELAFVFKKGVRLTRVNWSLAGQKDQALDLGGADGFSTEFLLPFQGAGTGTYRIEWRGLSEDGHPQKGTFEFVVE